MSVSKETKQAVLKAASFCCHYCSEDAATVDHKVPLIAGGSDARANLVAACEPCNTAKGSMPYDLFFCYIRRFGRPEHPRKWYQSTNWYIEGAISKILVNVDLDRALEIVLVKFSKGDPIVALSKIRRCNTAYGLKVDLATLETLCRDVPAFARGFTA
jgi:hypothetical protein